MLSVIRRWLWRLLSYALMLVFIGVAVRGSSVPLNEPFHAVAAVIRADHFDYVMWEAQALGAKLGEAAWGVGAYLPETERSDYVRAYITDLSRARQLAGQVESLYTDPTVEVPVLAAAELITERDALRASLQARQSLTESILEAQVAAVLVEEGFGVGGQLWPPMAMRFTQNASLLVVSPRDEIRMDFVMTLNPLPVDQRAAYESEIDSTQNVSSLIVPIGGMALYPAMVVETPNLPYLIETFAHEWLHHYLMFHPLGYLTELTQAADTRAINETTATVFGREIGQKVLARYYPEFAAPPIAAPSTGTVDAPPPPATPEPPRFDFAAEMNRTRTRVDELIAAGKIAAAEAYMEERRELFVANGYAIRKLNQAYFAFFGGYQAAGYGASGDDPIGPAVQALRDQSEDVKAWVVTIRTITTREALLAAVG